jgi:lysophospholipase L1-like esterase
MTASFKVIYNSIDGLYGIKSDESVVTWQELDDSLPEDPTTWTAQQRSYILGLMKTELQVSLNNFAIMPLGDSITGGYAGHSTYRKPLYYLLQSEYSDIDMVGYLNGPDDVTGDYDKNHAGFNTYTSSDVLGLMDNWILARDIPDIVILCIGHNDMVQSVPDATLDSNIRSIIDKCKNFNPLVNFLLCKIPQSTEASSAINNFNENYISDIVSDYTSSGMVISMVDLWTGFDTSEYTYDGVHPNELGESWIADKIYTPLSYMLEASS